MRHGSITRASRVAAAAIALVAVACSAPTKPQPPPAPHVRFTDWQAVGWDLTCVGGVVNDGTATAYTVWVSTSLHKEPLIVHAVTPDSLAPGQTGMFTATGEQLVLFGIVPPRVVEVGWQATRPPVAGVRLP